ncbi:MAG: DUF6531 domain-containing protein [Bdellovibrionia bacterium]
MNFPRISRTLLLLPLVQVPLIAAASVNMKDGNYFRTFTDGGILSRSYSSRSIHNGYFGYGWCSDLELRLDVTAPSEIRLERCGTVTTFTNIKKSVYIYGAKRLERLKDRFVLSDGGRRWTFESDGRLKNWRQGREDITLDLGADGRPLRIGSRRLGTWTIEWTTNKITKLETPHGRGVFYFYGGENLRRTVDSSSAPVSFSYDDLHNLTNVAGPGVETVVYDIGRDLVLELQREDGCSETFQYSRTTAAQEIMEIATADVECRGLHSNVSHEFVYLNRPGGGTVLTRVKSTVNGELRGSRDFEVRGPASRSVVNVCCGGYGRRDR